MSDKPAIDAEVVPTNPQALAKREQAGAVSVHRMTVDELKSNLDYIREIMRTVMKKGQDYGTVPGCGDKPALFQPGAQKLCMTFQLQDRVNKEEVRDLPNFHREYSFIITLTSATGREWDGVGTCSTLEAKYRYRQAARKCPKCGKENIRKSKQGDGWYCWTKTGGCGTNFPGNHPAIISQPEGKIEHDNPPDNWNTVRKMAFKRALVHATINATNTSELWTQDIEDSQGASPENQGEPENGDPTPDPAPNPPAPAPTPHPEPEKPATAAQAPSQAVPVPTVESRTKMIRWLKAGPGEQNRQTVTEYFRKLTDPTPLAPFEELENLPLRFVSCTGKQFKDLADRIQQFEAGHPATHAFPPHPEPKPLAKAVEKAFQEASAKSKDPLWWRGIIVPIPRKGMKKDEYLKHPDTLGGLYDLRHGNDEQAETARRRLWGFCQRDQAEGWTDSRGKFHEPSETDVKFYDAIRAFKVWFAANHPDEKL